jgi:hypothetical protein
MAINTFLRQSFLLFSGENKKPDDSEKVKQQKKNVLSGFGG